MTTVKDGGFSERNKEQDWHMKHFYLAILYFTTICSYGQVEKPFLLNNNPIFYETINVNHSITNATLQNLKRATVFIFEPKEDNNNVLNSKTTGTGVLVNTVTNTYGTSGRTVYILTASHVVPSRCNYNEECSIWLSFDYESTNGNNNSIPDSDVYLNIRKVYKIPVILRVLHGIKSNPPREPDLSMLEVVFNDDSNPNLETNKAFYNAYSMGWDLHVKPNDVYSNISHPESNHKQLFKNNVGTAIGYYNMVKSIDELDEDLLYEIRETGNTNHPELLSNLKYSNYLFFNTTDIWSNYLGLIKPGGSGSGLFNLDNNLVAIYSEFSENTDLINTFSAIQNAWYNEDIAADEEQFRKGHLMNYLDSDETWLSSTRGGYLNDLIPNNASVSFDLTVNEITPKNITLTGLDFFKINERTTLLESKLGAGILPAASNPNNDIVLYVIPDDFPETLLYGILYNDATPTAQNSVFKGIEWESGEILPPILTGLPKSEHDSNDIRNNILDFMKNELGDIDNDVQILSEFTTDAKLHLTSTSNKAKVRAIKLPYNLPYNAVELFKPDNFNNLWRSYHYKKSKGEEQTNGYYINSIKVELEQHVKVEVNNQEVCGLNKKQLNLISTDNNGGYLNLVNPNYLIDHVVASEAGCPKNKLTIALNTGTSGNKYYGAWIDYFRDKKLGNQPNREDDYTYNFRYDATEHEKEQLALDNTGEREFTITHEIPTAEDLNFDAEGNLKTRLRVAIAEAPQSGNTTLTQDGIYEKGEVEDYLVSIRKTSEKDRIQAKKGKTFDKISSAQGQQTPSGQNPSGDAQLPESNAKPTGLGGVDDAPVQNNLPLFSLSENPDLANLLDTAGDVVQVGINAFSFDGLTSMFIGGSAGGGGGGYDSKADKAVVYHYYDLIPDLVPECENPDACSRRSRNTTLNPDPEPYQVIYEEGGGENGFSVRYNSEETQYGVRINDRLEVATGPALEFDQYGNIAIGFNKGVMELYINGSLVATNNNFTIADDNGETYTEITENTDGASLGGISGPNGTIWDDDDENMNFHGKIDYFGATYNVLTEEEIADLTIVPSINPSSAKRQSDASVAPENITAEAQEEDETKESDFSIFPNPTKDQLNILVEVERAGALNIALYSLNGAKAYSVEEPYIREGHQLITLKNLNLPTGNYVLKVKAGGTVKTAQVIFE